MPLDATPLDLATLPAIVAGPVLRRVTRTDASVWIALTHAGPVTLSVREEGQGATEVSGAATAPVRVGANLWMAVVTGPAPGGAFQTGRLYEYRLTSPAWPEPNWTDVSIGTARPAFLGPPETVADLAVLHTSCRKVHGGGRDALSLAVGIVEDRIAANGATARPHLLVLSGDQIYADDVAAPLAPRIRRIAADLVGVDETDVFGPLPQVGGRTAPSESFGLTSGTSSDHLWTLGEFLALYLLSWSPVLWPAALPQWADVAPATDLDPASGLDEERWNAQLDAIARFREGLGAARRVLATVPSAMVFDDHEVTDDWNLDYGWAARVYADARGSRIVANGLMAGALCQHWGNRPDRFRAPGTAEAALLQAVGFTGASPDSPAVRGLLGIPAAVAQPPSVLRDVASPGTIRWDFTFGAAEGWPVRVVMLDERTVREFSRVDHPAARISMAGLAAMLPGPPPGATEEATIVVAPSPILGLHIVEHVIQPAVALVPGASVHVDFESWRAATPNHEELRRLSAYERLVLLSGDVHYAMTASLDYTRGAVHVKAAQVTSSSSKNAEPKTMILHLLGDFAMKLGIERERSFAGYDALSAAQRAELASPPTGTALAYDELVDVMLGRVFRAGQETPAVLATGVADAYGLGPADWTYAITPVDDETMPSAGPLADAMAAVDPPWPGWDPQKSWGAVAGLRASDLHRIGRMFVGLPVISLVDFTAGPVTVHHRLTAPVGARGTDTATHPYVTSVVIG